MSIGFLCWQRHSQNIHIRYGVVANIAVSHTAAGGSIPPIGVRYDNNTPLVLIGVDWFLGYLGW
ncbi:uncharacterized protein N7482_009560, partial [Penicillium canariense]